MTDNALAVQNVLAQLDGWDRADSNALKPLLDFSHPFVIWDSTAAVVDGSIYQGRQGVVDFFVGWLRNWREWDFEIESLFPVGDRVVTVMREWGVSHHGIRSEQRHAQVWTLRAGRLIHLRVFPSVDQARSEA